MCYSHSLDKLLHSPDRDLNRGLRIRAMLIQQIDPVRLQSLQARLDGLAHDMAVGGRWWCGLEAGGLKGVDDDVVLCGAYQL